MAGQTFRVAYREAFFGGGIASSVCLDSGKLQEDHSTVRRLTDKQAAFVREYLIDLNATQAAIRAGYSARTADKIGPELMGKTRVRDAIDKALSKRAHRVDIRAEDVLRGVVEVTIQARESGDLKTALKGYELQGKHLGLFSDRVKAEISGPDGGPVQTSMTLNLDGMRPEEIAALARSAFRGE